MRRSAPSAYARRHRPVGAALAACAALAAAPSLASAVTSPDLLDDVATFRLDSGLTVVVAPRRGSPVVAVQAWVGAGAADEPPGHAGIAHVVEHMVFKGTSRRGVGELTAVVEAAGGDVNAWTSFDQTVYHAVLGSGELDVGLDVLADALTASTFDEAELAREREVVVQELRQGLDDPARTVAHALFGTAYLVHPYRRPVIGTLESVRGLRRDDVVAFHRAAYVADNLTVVVAGDVTPDDARRRVEAHFAGLPAGPVRRLRATEPPQHAPRATWVTQATSEAQLALGFHAPPLRHADTPLLDLAAVALGYGESSPLAALRHDRELVTGAAAHLHALRDPGLFVVNATVRPERLEQAAAALGSLLADAAAALPEADLEKARTAVLAEEVWQRETAEGLARKYGWHHSTAGDVRFERAYVERVRRARPAEVRAALGRWVAPSRATVAAVTPPRRGLATEAGRSRAAQRLAARVAEGPGGRRRRGRAAAPAPVAPAAGDVRREVLPSGLRVLVLRDPAVPVVAMRAVWPGGTRLEDDASSGTTSLLASVITRGCGARDAAAFADEVDRLAGGIAGVGGRNSFGLRAEWLAASWSAGLDLLADCILAPRLDRAEVERQRRLLIDDLAARADSGAHQAMRLFSRALYRDHPYRLDVLGDPEALAEVTPRRLARFYAARYPVGALTLAIVGDVDPDAVLAQVRARFAELPAAAAAAAPAVPAPRFDGRPPEVRTVFADLPREPAHLGVGFPGATVDAEDRFALEVLAAILGGQSGRLFAELRDRQALAYRVSAFSVDGLDPGYFAIHVACSPDKLDAAAAAIRGELDRLRAEGVTADEVRRAVRHLAGAHAVAMQRRAAVANALAFHEAYGLGWQRWASYPDALAGLDAAAIDRVVRRYLDWDVAVTASVRPPAVTPGVVRRAKGKVDKAPPRRGGRGRPARPTRRRSTS